MFCFDQHDFAFVSHIYSDLHICSKRLFFCGVYLAFYERRDNLICNANQREGELLV